MVDAVQSEAQAGENLGDLRTRGLTARRTAVRPYAGDVGRESGQDASMSKSTLEGNEKGNG